MKAPYTQGALVIDGIERKNKKDRWNKELARTRKINKIGRK